MADAARVLVVEDEASIAQVIVDVLSAEGYDVRLAAHGREALEILADWLPGLIILDLMMPVMDGPTFRQHQRRLDVEQATVPVIILSGARETRSRAEELDVAIALTKPFEIDDLLTHVRRLTRR